MVVGEGMPLYKNPFEKGRLIIQFQINFPENNAIQEKNLEKLEAIMPPREDCIVTDDMEMVTLSDYTLEHESRGHHGGGNAYDEDDENQMPRGMQCQSH